MARKLRVQYPGAIYHVMNRGDRREDIFRDDQDRQQWLKTLADEVGKEQIRYPQTAAALVESRARQRLRNCRLALRQKAAEMILEQQSRRAERDRAICTFVATLQAAAPTCAA